MFYILYLKLAILKNNGLFRYDEEKGENIFHNDSDKKNEISILKRLQKKIIKKEQARLNEPKQAIEKEILNIDVVKKELTSEQLVNAEQKVDNQSTLADEIAEKLGTVDNAENEKTVNAQDAAKEKNLEDTGFTILGNENFQKKLKVLLLLLQIPKYIFYVLYIFFAGKKGSSILVGKSNSNVIRFEE